MYRSPNEVDHDNGIPKVGACINPSIDSSDEDDHNNILEQILCDSGEDFRVQKRFI